jgi:hypothetical protein
MPFDARRGRKFRTAMRRRIEELRARTEDSLDFAVEHVMQDRVDSFFKVEQGLEEIGHTLGLIEEELEHVHDLATAMRLESRLEFMEDRFEELDSEARQRPGRRRRRINLADFFKATAGGGERAGYPNGEITNIHDAYAALGLSYGSPMRAVTAAFRLRAKHLHPDARKGDRSSEPELRRIIEAYQYLKERENVMQAEPPRDS